MSKPKSKKSADQTAPVQTRTGADAPAADALPDRETVEAALVPVRDFIAAPEQARIRNFLRRLAERPPQVLLLEGGSAEERLAAAHFWGMLLNCDKGAPESTAPPQNAVSLSLLAPTAPATEAPAGQTPLSFQNESLPCLACPSCLRMLMHLHRDCCFLDGLAGSIKIDDVRALRAVLGEPPREARRRIVIFREAQSLVEAAANALLKSFEEPRPATSFLLLAPQRERLLPTLVSRSFVLTLPWRSHRPAQSETQTAWEAALCRFIQTGQGLFDRTGAKGAVDAALAHEVVNLCRRALVAGITDMQAGKLPGEGLAAVFARIPAPRLRMLDEALAESQDSLIFGVNPALVLEWLATRAYFLVPRR